MEQELIDIYDENGNKTGKTVNRDEIDILKQNEYVTLDEFKKIIENGEYSFKRFEQTIFYDNDILETRRIV